MTADLPVPNSSGEGADTNATLSLISRARRSLAEARSLPDIHRVIEAASVLADAAQRAARLAEAQHAAAEIVNAASEAANDAAAIRIEAQAKAGEILRRLREDGQVAGQGRPKKRSTAANFSDAEGAGAQTRTTSPVAPSLDELGVSKDDSSRWQRVAAVPADVRREYVDQTKAAKREVSTAGLLRHAQNRAADERDLAQRSSTDHAAIGAESRKRMRAAYICLVALPGYRPESLVAAIDPPERQKLLRTLNQLPDWIDDVRRELAVLRVSNEE